MQIMVTIRQIRTLADQIGRRFQPRQIILFGSYAYGVPTADSDVDLLVIMPCRGSTADKEFAIRQSFHAPFAWDVIVRTPMEIERRLKWNDFFVKEITLKGRLLYEASDAGMGEKGRGRFPKRPARVAGQKASKLRRRVLPRAAVH